MPVIQRRPAVLGRKHNASLRNSSDSDDTLREYIVIVEDEYEKPQKEMDFPSAKLVNVPNIKSKNSLRINTYSRSELHDRYMSSEEEPSPSPDSEESHEEELKHKPSARFEDPIDLSAATESKAEIAIAVPILSLGRPKLVDITNFAPMHKRKQRIPKSQLSHSAAKVPSTHLATVLDENTSFPKTEAAEMVTSPPPPKPTATLKRKESKPLLTVPESWLPDDEALASDDEHHIPRLDVRRTPSYHDYDPYSLEPPRLAASPKGSVSRARGNPGHVPVSNHTSGWKGLTRSLSIAKKQHSHQQVTKKPKMVARGANEREGPLVIPPFPFEEAGALA